MYYRMVSFRKSLMLNDIFFGHVCFVLVKVYLSSYVSFYWAYLLCVYREKYVYLSSVVNMSVLCL